MEQTKIRLFKNQSGEIATFISIAVLIGIAVMTFVTANITSNTAQKQTTSTKAAEICDGAVYKTCNNYYRQYDYNRGQCCGRDYKDGEEDEESGVWHCDSYPGYDLGQDANGTYFCVGPEQCDSNYVVSCDGELGYSQNESGQCCKTEADPVASVPVDPAETGICDCINNTYNDQCGDDSGLYCEIPSSTVPQSDGSADGSDFSSYDLSVSNDEDNNGCTPSTLICDPTIFSCEDGSDPVSTCRVRGYNGICCGSAESAPPVVAPEPEMQSASLSECEKIGGTCLVDVWPASVDESIYEKLTNGDCPWTESLRSCYRKRIVPPTEEEKAQIDANSQNTEQGVVYINDVERRTYSFSEGGGGSIEITYVPGSYDADHPAKVSVQVNGDEIDILRPKDVDYHPSFNLQQKKLDTQIESKEFYITE